MPIVVEDGTGLPDANAYVAIADVDAASLSGPYATPKWNELSDDLKEQNLVVATAWLDSMVVWLGYPLTSTQALQWPRSGVVIRGARTPENPWGFYQVIGVPGQVRQADSFALLAPQS